MTNLACTSYLANPAATKHVLHSHDLHLKKSLGQNFLVSDAIVKKIVDLADVCADDKIVEVGPGIGTLTVALLGCGAKVASIEKDERLYDVLYDTTCEHTNNFELIKSDALASDIKLPFAPTKLVSNLPYAVAATIILDYFDRFESLQSATVMVQREVADRIKAAPNNKNYGAYTVKLALRAKVCDSFKVAASNFMPPPHVESTVVRLERTNCKLNSNVAGLNFCDAAPCDDDILLASKFADIAFAQRRKTIYNNFRASGFFSDASKGDTSDMFLRDCGIEPGVRGETLEPATYLKMAHIYKEKYAK